MLILLSVCLISSPATCREERLSWSFEEASTMACMVRSQEAVAEWQVQHPDWKVDRWSCVARRNVPTNL